MLNKELLLACGGSDAILEITSGYFSQATLKLSGFHLGLNLGSCSNPKTKYGTLTALYYHQTLGTSSYMYFEEGNCGINNLYVTRLDTNKTFKFTWGLNDNDCYVCTSGSIFTSSDNGKTIKVKISDKA